MGKRTADEPAGQRQPRIKREREREKFDRVWLSRNDLSGLFLQLFSQNNRNIPKREHTYTYDYTHVSVSVQARFWTVHVRTKANCAKTTLTRQSARGLILSQLIWEVYWLRKLFEFYQAAIVWTIFHPP